jgi:hypothetical protein
MVEFRHSTRDLNFVLILGFLWGSAIGESLRKGLQPMIERLPQRVVFCFATAFASLLTISANAAEDGFVKAVIATGPIGYFRLDSTEGKSQVGTTTYKSIGGVTSNGPGGPVGGGGSYFAKLNGHDGYVVTSQAGGVGVAASIMAWVNLDELPSKSGHYFYVAGESQNGNDLDLQFETDNSLKFFTASGGRLAYAPDSGSLVHQWHMVLATLDTQTQTRTIYWDGKQVASDKGGGRVGKTGTFSIGESTVFRGRYFQGGIAEVALWSHALKASEVASIYAASGAAARVGGQQTGSVTIGADSASSSLFPNHAKVDVEDPNGPVKLKSAEQTAFLFLSAMQMIEGDCQMNAKRACTLDQMISGATGANGGRGSRLKYNPKSDPNYTYTVFASGLAWEVHATAKKPGLIGFCFLSRSYPSVIVTYSPSGTAGFVDTELPNRSIEGDSFQVP